MTPDPIEATTLPYALARPFIRSGDLLAWEGTSRLGRMVRWWTGSRWSHVGIAWAIADRVMVIEAMEGIGVRIAPLSLPGYRPFWHIPTGVDWTPEVEHEALSAIDKAYGYRDLLRALFGMKPADNDRYVCSEYAARVLRSAGKLPPMDEFNPVSPAELVGYFVDGGAVPTAIA